MKSLKSELLSFSIPLAGGWALLSVVIAETLLAGHPDALARVRIPIYLISALGLAGTAMLGSWYAQRLSARLQRVADGARQVAQGEGGGVLAQQSSLEELSAIVGNLEDTADAVRKHADEVKELRGLVDVVAAKAGRIAGGDLTVDGESLAEESALAEVDSMLNQVAAMMRNQLGGLKEMAAALQESALQMTSATAQLASSANEQAAAISQATSTAEEIKQTGLTARDNAHRIVEVAENSVSVSTEGKQAAADSVVAMNRVEEHVETITRDVEGLRVQVSEVGEIIASVAGIAEQSNLLAVNASIEAAKAGEFGRGFAVVAHEVKNLAEQSKRATVQVRNTLGKIQNAIGAVVDTARTGRQASGEGVETIEHTGKVIGRLAATIADTTEAAQAIAIGANEQVVGMEQMTHAMTSINQAANENLKVTGEVESTGRGFAAMAGEVANVVAQYKVSV